MGIDCNALILVISIAVVWTGGTQLTRVAAGGPSPPFFTYWFVTCWLILAYPISLLLLKMLRTINIIDASKEETIPHTYNNLRFFFLRACAFYPLFLGANYLYVKALIISPAATVVAIFRGASPIFVFVLSLLLLRSEQTRTKLSLLITSISIALAVVGVVIISLHLNLDVKINILSPVLVVLSALLASSYEVLFKKFFGYAKLREVALHISCLGIVNAIAAWWIWLLLNHEGAEPIDFKTIPWNILFIASVASLLFNTLINFGIAISSPIYVVLGITLGIPFNFLVDITLNGIAFSSSELFGAGLVMFGIAFEVIVHAVINYRNALNTQELSNGAQVQLKNSSSHVVDLEFKLLADQPAQGDEAQS